MQGFLLLSAQAPRGSVVLFPGADGDIHLDEGGTLEHASNFLVRVRMDFVAAGYNVAIVDSPSDQASLRDFRTTPAHAVDIKGVIAYLRTKNRGPVWLIGTSRGTVSATNAAARLREGGPDGVVLTSTVTLSSSGAAQTSVYNTDLAAIRVPVLILSHRSDGCPVTPMHASEELVAKLTGAPAVDFRTVSGGKPPESGACAPYSPHGYFGVEQQATSIIIPWMKAHEPPR
jgi:pimeloyl-ACP methyl ester carboxylesterase